MERGTIKKINDRGFGFIRPADNFGSDIFFHRSSLQNLKFDQDLVGCEVLFIREDSEKGERCQIVQAIDHTPVRFPRGSA